LSLLSAEAPAGRRAGLVPFDRAIVKERFWGLIQNRNEEKETHTRPDNGVPLKMWSLIDEYSRQGLRIEVDRNLKGKETPDALAGAMAGRA
jgi:hypothetical protein|tara:strand:- start:488 stop:760 length:273 start_codon:yes stop_codon:yes gene_type:complete